MNELEYRRQELCRHLETAAANPGLYPEADCAQWRAELTTVDKQIGDLNSANFAHNQRLVEQSTGYRFDRVLTDAGTEAIASARTELDRAKKRAADAITNASQEVREKAAELDAVMTEHGQVYRFPAFNSVALELARLAEESFRVRG